MPNYLGMNIAELIDKYSEGSYIIYLTSYDKYAVKAYGVNVASYVLKSQFDNEFEDAINRLFECIRRSKTEKTYTICNERRYIKFLQKDILYIYKDEKNAVFVLSKDVREWERNTLQKVYQKLDNSDMYPLGRYAILNLRNVMRITDKRIKMKGGYEIEASKACINELKERLISYLGGFS